MWYDSETTKRISEILYLIEVGANNGWMDSDGEYYDQQLEKDEHALNKLTQEQRNIFGL